VPYQLHCEVPAQEEILLELKLTLDLELELFELDDVVATELLLTAPPHTAPVTTGVSAEPPFKSP
jgi:hypothetical protein